VEGREEVINLINFGYTPLEEQDFAITVINKLPNMFHTNYS